LPTDKLSKGSTKAQPDSDAAALQRCEESDPRRRQERRAIVLREEPQAVADRFGVYWDETLRQ
jgi:hypothetical protein